MKKLIQLFFIAFISTSSVSAQSLFPFLYVTTTTEATAAPHEHIERWGTTTRNNVYIRDNASQIASYSKILPDQGTHIWVEAEYFTDDGFSWYEVVYDDSIWGFIRSDLLKIMEGFENE